MGCSTEAHRLHKVTTLNYVTEIYASKGQPSNPRIKTQKPALGEAWLSGSEIFSTTPYSNVCAV
jgi:hypothetical protein